MVSRGKAECHGTDSLFVMFGSSTCSNFVAGEALLPVGIGFVGAAICFDAQNVYEQVLVAVYYTLSRFRFCRRRRRGGGGEGKAHGQISLVTYTNGEATTKQRV